MIYRDQTLLRDRLDEIRCCTHYQPKGMYESDAIAIVVLPCVIGFLCLFFILAAALGWI